MEFTHSNCQNVTHKHLLRGRVFSKLVVYECGYWTCEDGCLAFAAVVSLSQK